MVGRAVVRNAFSMSSRSKFIKRDKEGVASTVGTIMALLVFLTLITLFTNTYIPIWMKENEKNHMDEVLKQFRDLKGKVNSLIVNAPVTSWPTINMYQPMTMGSDGIPIFATATAGFLFLKPGGPLDQVESGVKVDFYYKLTEGDTEHFIDPGGGGSLEFYGPNRYYVQQWYTYENGALLIYQEDGMALRASPSLVFSKSGDSIDVRFDQIDIIGDNSSIGGQGSGGVIIGPVHHESQDYSICGSDGKDDGTLTLTFKTRYDTVWMNVIEEAAGAAGMEKDRHYTLACSVPLTDEYRPLYLITLTINRVDQFTYNRGYVIMKLEY